MTDNDIKSICGRIESLHEKILKSKFAETVTESEMLSLVFAVRRLNDQKAEIERLEKSLVDQFDGYENIRKKAKAEAVKEFAKRLKAYLIKCRLPLLGLSTKEEIEDYFNDIMMQVGNAIDNLVKEMAVKE